MLPREKFDKNGAIWSNLGILKYAITKLKINNFKVKQSTTTKVNCHFFPEVNVDVRYTKRNTFRSYKGGGSGELSPQRQKNFLKIKQNGGFSFIFFFAFWQGSPDPQNYELAPQLP